MRLLTPEFVSLVHHVELNEAGWWEKTIQRIITSILWNPIEGLSTFDIRYELQEQFGISSQLTSLDEHIAVLENDGSVFTPDKVRYRLTEDRRRKVEHDISAFMTLESHVKELFGFLATSHCSTLDVNELWTNMNDNLITPLLAEMGARTYELLSQKVTRIDKSTSFLEFLSHFPVESQHGVNRLITDFMNPSNYYVRSYILGRLNAYFSAQASNLDKKAIASVTKASGRSITFKLFIDTNFLFSILGLHDNPSNDAASSLISLIKRLENDLKIELYVASITIEEMRTTLIYQINNIKHICQHKRLCDI